jgi:23S rRNA pseudouridine1911/1915/1917 synthase
MSDDDLEDILPPEGPPDLVEGIPPAAIPGAGGGAGGPIDWEVRIRSEGMRLDRYVHLYFKDFSRSILQNAIDRGSILVNGKQSKSSYKVRPGDHLKIQLPAPTHDTPVPEDIPLEIVYEDEWLAIVNKPYDMVVHPAKGNWSGTLVNALSFRFKELSMENGSYRAGIVHRLDRDTSGAILIAKEASAHRELALAFEERRVFKEYAAITAGVLDRDSDYLEGRIKHHPTDRVKMFITNDKNDPDAKDACTYYEVIERFRGYTFVRCQPRTGRTHQIRLHLASVDCPVLADKMYGGRDHVKLSDLNGSMPGSPGDRCVLNRQALHAWHLRFKHPKLGRWMEFEAPLPEDFLDILNMIRQHRS